MKNSILLPILALSMMLSCQQNRQEQQGTIAMAQDYNAFLDVHKTRTNSRYFELWNGKISEDSLELPSFGIVAGQYRSFFESSGDIQYLKKAEQALEKAVEIANLNQDQYHRALSRNYISQHRFQDALVQAEKAWEYAPGLPANDQLLFDVYMELGRYTEADSLLTGLKSMTNFGYLIRAAKWNDYLGNLDTTISLMEKARDRAEDSQDRTLRLWTYTNLADYYGHANRINESCNHYLKALAIDSSYAYAKKGLAWIAYAHDDRPEEALRILDEILQSHRAPEYYLLQAEIAEYLGDQDKAQQANEQFLSMTSNPAYGSMYATYHIERLLKSDPPKALSLAEDEVRQRATPETYHLLALAQLANGQLELALETVVTKIDGKTFEPLAQWTMAQVYKANGMHEKADTLKSELLAASYELGPLTVKEIENL
ncbi:tetratricopeptide repeat protein [Croceiramulus getboli]|nr:hypothetical protein P8624_11030 [Flavobacteriaceae bacterium YJPT1-3]